MIFNAFPSAWQSVCKNRMSDCCTCSFFVYCGFSLLSYSRDRPASPAICPAIAFRVVFSQLRHFFCIRNVDVYGMEVPLNVVFIGGPARLALSISNVPQFSTPERPLPFQSSCASCTCTILTDVAAGPLPAPFPPPLSAFPAPPWVSVPPAACTACTASVGVAVTCPPVVILNTCPG